MSGAWVERPHRLPDRYVPPSASLNPPTNVKGEAVAERPTAQQVITRTLSSREDMPIVGDGARDLAGLVIFDLSCAGYAIVARSGSSEERP